MFLKQPEVCPPEVPGADSTLWQARIPQDHQLKQGMVALSGIQNSSVPFRQGDHFPATPPSLTTARAHGRVDEDAFSPFYLPFRLSTVTFPYVICKKKKKKTNIQVNGTEADAIIENVSTTLQSRAGFNQVCPDDCQHHSPGTEYFLL